MLSTLSTFFLDIHLSRPSLGGCRYRPQAASQVDAGTLAETRRILTSRRISLQDHAMVERLVNEVRHKAVMAVMAM